MTTDKKRAIISVFDKTDIVEFAKELQEKYNYEIVSTGSTAKLLSDNNVETIPVSEITATKEMLSGKVKTLHPSIHAGILADINNSLEAKELADNGIEAFDMVVVNLYPFEQVASQDHDEQTLIDNIDIGGVALLRAGAKNNKNVTVVSNIQQYKKVLENLKENNGQTTPELKKQLALSAFELTSKYDAVIAAEFSDDKDRFKQIFLTKEGDLRYGENPHQKAALYNSEQKTAQYEFLNGKELSYNNILDMTAALNIISEFYDVNAVAIVKHNTPCGVALGKSINEAYLKAFDSDPVSAFGGIIAFTKPVDKEIAKHASSMFLEVVIAPDFEAEALEILKKKKNLRIIKLTTPLKEYKTLVQKEIKITPFGTLVQDIDTKELDKDSFEVVTKKKPTAEMVEDMVFAWKVCKHVKSNAIVVAKDFKTLAICGGQTSRVDAMETALNRACDGAKDAVAASDGFFPAIDNILAAAQCRIAGLIQPGGSIKDKEVIEAADKYNMVMINTGIRHFKH